MTKNVASNKPTLALINPSSKLLRDTHDKPHNFRLYNGRTDRGEMSPALLTS
ncbi:hypothetical protein PILCRDRAFT_9152 [Piloderma croceum F 1598]|uniref:Uncharacterized protein n=1 Tax=Piloderma croceum (strain F 1598) TaxID=765440 RepID=A0A0C3B4K6_PILCF|nr:hypothetical protein PILCRDRAFT_9152 [Piloderma croceum F 1598]